MFTPRGALAVFVCAGVCVWNSNKKIWIHWKFCPQRYWDPAYLLSKNMGDNFISVLNLMARNYFWGITELNWEKMATAENLYPPKKGKFMLQSLDPKIWLSNETTGRKTWHTHSRMQTPAGGFTLTEVTKTKTLLGYPSETANLMRPVTAYKILHDLYGCF